MKKKEEIKVEGMKNGIILEGIVSRVFSSDKVVSFMLENTNERGFKTTLKAITFDLVDDVPEDGDRVIVYGGIGVESYEDKKGNKKYINRIVYDKIELCEV